MQNELNLARIIFCIKLKIMLTGRNIVRSIEITETTRCAMSETQADNQLLIKWADARKLLDEAKENERNLREQVFASYFAPTVGTQTKPLANGWKLKASVSESRKLVADATQIDELLQQYPVLKEVGAVKFEPKLVYGAIKTLVDREAVQALEAFIEVSQGSPTITIEAPKDNK